jgi:exopolyphosphatase/guanosine-5'-triphosphate,3'-diphosphate pyrophosphatase
VITGDEEARLTLLGVRSALGTISAGTCMVLDVGGGSTEVVLALSAGERKERSFPLGAVYLTERFLLHDPPHQEEITRLRMSVREALRSFVEAEGTVRPDALIGTAGTITTLAAMQLGMGEYDPVRINGSRLTRQDLDRLVAVLAGKSIVERRALQGLEPGREDIILAGAIVVQEIMELTGAADMLVSDWGLREGIVLDLYEKFRGTRTM